MDLLLFRDHVQHHAPGGENGALLRAEGPRQGSGGDAHQDKADLGHGGAGQGPLEIGGEYRQHRPQHHGDNGGRQQDQSEHPGFREHRPGGHQNAVHAHLGQKTRQQRAGGSGGHRVGLWEPHVEREHAGLGAEAQENAHTCGDNPAPIGPVERVWQGVEGQGPRLAEEQDQPHEQDQAADDRHSQIGAGGTDGFVCPFVEYPGEGAQGQDLKKDISGHEVR